MSNGFVMPPTIVQGKAKVNVGTGALWLEGHTHARITNLFLHTSGL